MKRIGVIVLLLFLAAGILAAIAGAFLLSGRNGKTKADSGKQEAQEETAEPGVSSKVQEETAKPGVSSGGQEEAEETGTNPEAQEEAAADEEQTEEASEETSVVSIDFERLSDNRIQLVCKVSQPQYAEKYIVMRRRFTKTAKDEDWQELGCVMQEGEEQEFSFIDVLKEPEPQQYEYRVDICASGEEDAQAKEGASILASNIKICVDPGHYQGINFVEGEDSYGYAEGDFTLPLAQELAVRLKEGYGIDSCLTRTGGSITLYGYTDDELDLGHISLRGEYAGDNDCDLFLSLHTNANNDYANGYDTWQQPLEINKTIVIMNTVACASQQYIDIGNAIGQKVTAVSYELGLSKTGTFQTVLAGNITQWTDSYNDSLDANGTVVCRLKEDESTDYYGVLRGSALRGVPGIIVEHGHHTVSEVRRQAMEGNLAKLWAAADAEGIAEGYGFLTESRKSPASIAQSNKQG